MDHNGHLHMDLVLSLILLVLAKREGKGMKRKLASIIGKLYGVSSGRGPPPTPEDRFPCGEGNLGRSTPLFFVHCTSSCFTSTLPPVEEPPATRDHPTALSSGGVHHPDCSLHKGLIQCLTKMTGIAIRKEIQGCPAACHASMPSPLQCDRPMFCDRSFQRRRTDRRLSSTSPALSTMELLQKVTRRGGFVNGRRDVCSSQIRGCWDLFCRCTLTPPPHTHTHHPTSPPHTHTHTPPHTHTHTHTHTLQMNRGL
ncbi:hypothetical protein F7725_029186 [Dissostichus mawsoni]|uniref:Uncharacterized protein n=1 Tax=Dissostichus mawsoni TaxID=36200 RepID=A0A7J5XKA8_DISMA|nr:hypothetical protein F7725_029186 [Dissostichus mawsoni]